MASVLAVALLGALVLAAAAVLALGQVVVVRQRTATAADMAALAAAAAVLRGADDAAACGRADEVARSGGASLDTCAVQGADVSVEVSRALPGIAAALARWAGGAVIRARSRAGPSASSVVSTSRGPTGRP
jgi:secretion/DNA translocation related TadE-like protein